ncbi:MAG TPA: transposase, partial [Candidatus Udaeobacter sp.]
AIGQSQSAEEKLLESIPGIGPLFSSVIATEIDGIKRFNSSAKLAAYAGVDFVTVFEIARGGNGVLAEEYFRLFIGIAALIGGVTALILNWRNNGGLKGWLGPVFVIAWGLFWLYLHNFPYVFGHINNLVTAYRDGQYQIVEGQVQVLHEQPATGHTKGDIITVNGKQFEVNYFYLTPAYRNTLAHGGVLNWGVYARICYYNGKILRVDIRK